MEANYLQNLNMQYFILCLYTNLFRGLKFRTCRIKIAQQELLFRSFVLSLLYLIFLSNLTWVKW